MMNGKLLKFSSEKSPAIKVEKKELFSDNPWHVLVVDDDKAIICHVH